MPAKIIIDHNGFGLSVWPIVQLLGEALQDDHWQAAAAMCRMLDSLIANHAPAEKAPRYEKGKELLVHAQGWAQQATAAFTGEAPAAPAPAATTPL